MEHCATAGLLTLPVDHCEIVDPPMLATHHPATVRVLMFVAGHCAPAGFLTLAVDHATAGFPMLLAVHSSGKVSILFRTLSFYSMTFTFNFSTFQYLQIFYFSLQTIITFWTDLTF
jgi:hypothetical protein